MKNTTQENWVLEQLNTTGQIDRNTCLRNYISRLGAIIHDLKKKGYKFRTENKDGNYFYYLETAVLEARQVDNEVSDKQTTLFPTTSRTASFRQDLFKKV